MSDKIKMTLWVCGVKCKDGRVIFRTDGWWTSDYPDTVQFSDDLELIGVYATKEEAIEEMKYCVENGRKDYDSVPLDGEFFVRSLSTDEGSDEIVE